ncbi:MAG: methylated-DNA--[protein]-cysteine S-methyltransferase, partial [Candidatus Binatia bacterium]
SRLGRVEGVEAIPDGAEAESLYRDLLEYVEGRCTRLDWPLDLRLARSPFHRAVLEATARIPYGAVRSYAGVANEIGKPTATRAVAQALRTNPLPIVVPCHRVIGTSGALTGYAGRRTSLKRQLLAVEGVPAVKWARDFRVPRESMYVFAPDREYCLPTCEWVATTPAQRLVLFGSRERAEAAGLEPCGECRPDLHPISHG